MMMGFRSIFSISLIKKGLRNLKERGFSDTLRKTKSRILPGSIYRERMKTPLFTDEELASQREDVGAVGAMLYYPDNTVQHAGVILGIGGVGGHAHKYFSRGSYGYMSRMCYPY